MHNNKRKNGFTMAEALMVVAIIAVLAALIFVAIFAYLRSMTKLEYDGCAKEIFIAAQNHLSMAESQGYLGRGDFGTPEKDEHGDLTGIYYFIKDGSHSDVDDENSVLNLMLPFAAVDETVRGGGCYIIRYHKDSGTVLDVFYWQENGRYDHIYADDYASFMEKRADKDELKTYTGDKSVIGYYGGADASGLTRGAELKTPLISVSNADKLIVTVTDTNSANDKARIKLIITGVTSKSRREIPLSSSSATEFYSNSDVYRNSDDNYVFTLTLDDITQSGKHFSELLGPNGFIPGEDITVQAVSYNNSELTNVAYSTKQTTNSLFAYNDSDKASAHISNIRHLENLDRTVSELNVSNTELKHNRSDGSVKALQTTDISWSGWEDRSVYDRSGPLTDKKYYPVNTDYVLEYDGQRHAVSAVSADRPGAASGMFGSLTGDTVKNLKLIDFTISGSNAGALAGDADGATVTNVVAYNSTGSAAANITASGSAGGLIGSAERSTVTKSAAALTVVSTGDNAGGLIGYVKDGGVIACFSGGHTVNGAFSADGYNVTSAANAGGLVGAAYGMTLSESYSTCSAKGKNAGGIAAVTSGGSIDNCYAAGKVEGSEAEGAFAAVPGETTVFGDKCRYYQIVNERDSGADGKTYLPAAPSGSAKDIVPFDADSAGFNAYLTAVRMPASAYDGALVQYYRGGYALITVGQLGADLESGDFVASHYGDWPAPEVRIINR
ncbi:MAG: type II secretion system protein [Clostridia bacterium]|nr:type II secretion system protein [Clostridia bacterium]